jgi:predicted outer membrane protein
MRKWLPVTGLILLLSNDAAFAQTSIRPDPTPRLPPQSGQGLPLEDRQFISRALNLSEAEIEAGRLAMQKASDPGIKEFSQRLATEHEKVRETLRQIAEKNGISVDPQASRPAWQGELQKIEGRSGADFDREYMTWQLHTHLATVNLYQVQASNTPQIELASFAITRLAEIQRLFDEAKRLGAKHGVAIETIKQPPQY